MTLGLLLCIFRLSLQGQIHSEGFEPVNPQNMPVSCMYAWGGVQTMYKVQQGGIKCDCFCIHNNMDGLSRVLHSNTMHDVLTGLVCHNYITSWHIT